MNTAAQQIARAMAAQVDRVNSDPARLRAALDQANEENARLRARLDRLRRECDALQSRIAALEDGGAVMPDQPIGQFYDGRPYLTAQQAADRTRLSLATVNRYCHCGHWQAVQPDGYHWIVFADQPLAAKTHPRR